MIKFQLVPTNTKVLARFLLYIKFFINHYILITYNGFNKHAVLHF